MFTTLSLRHIPSPLLPRSIHLPSPLYPAGPLPYTGDRHTLKSTTRISLPEKVKTDGTCNLQGTSICLENNITVSHQLPTHECGLQIRANFGLRIVFAAGPRCICAWRASGVVSVARRGRQEGPFISRPFPARPFIGREALLPGDTSAALRCHRQFFASFHTLSPPRDNARAARSLLSEPTGATLAPALSTPPAAGGSGRCQR